MVVLVVIAGFYMAWNIGANDVANAMGTSVGSGALTHRKAMVVAGIFEFCGAFLVGSHVTDTLRKGIIDPSQFETQVLMLGMVAALLGAGTALLVATWLGRPVSTTHAIVGAIAGFGLLVLGTSAVEWRKIGEIALSWVISPLLAGTAAYFVFGLIERLIINDHDPVRATRRWFPAFVFFVFMIMTMVTIFKGLKNLNLNLTFNAALLVAGGVGLLAALVGALVIRRVPVPQADDDAEQSLQPLSVERGVQELASRVSHLRAQATGQVGEKLDDLDRELAQLAGELQPEGWEKRLRPELRFVERAFGWLQVLSACFVAFAHGSNDVANAIGPVAAVVTLAKSGAVGLAAKAPVPVWVLLLGGVGIVVGLATFGLRVMMTIGKRITDLTPTRGFAAEVSAATTIVFASRLGLPISTTHVLVGGVLGVGLARGIASINPAVLRDIVVAWVVQIPMAAFFCMLFYWLLQAIF